MNNPETLQEGAKESLQTTLTAVISNYNQGHLVGFR